MKRPELFIWVDLETTDIDPKAEGSQILEVAIILTDGYLKKLDSYESTVRLEKDVKMSSWCIKQHASSGLLQACANHGHSRDDVIKGIVGLIDSHISCEAEKIVLAGSSVHFDRAWLQEHWPTVLDDVSHRNFDVSSVAMLMNHVEPPPRPTDHRAMSDIEWSLECARAYLLHVSPPL